MVGVGASYSDIDTIGIRAPQGSPAGVGKILWGAVVYLVQVEPDCIVPFSGADNAIDDRDANGDVVFAYGVLHCVSGHGCRTEQNK